MRSDGRPARALALLRSQGLGVACGLATVVLLAAGTFALDRTRDGASAAIGMDELRPFFERPALAHAWLYLLAPVLALYALNVLLATWESVVRKWRTGVRAAAAYGPALLHVGFALALVAHLASGLWGGDRGAVLLAEGAAWRPLSGGREARLVSLEVEALPGGMPKAARAAIEVRDGAGRVERADVGYNAPLSDRLATDLHLLADLGRVRVARLSIAGAECVAPEGEACTAGGHRVEVALAAPAGALGPEAVARVRVDGGELWLRAGRDAPLADGRPIRLEQAGDAPAVLLRAREAPGNPIALAGALLAAAGLVMMARRFWPARRAGAPAAGDDDVAAAA